MRGTTNTATQTPNTINNADSTAAAVGYAGSSGAAGASAAEPSETEGARQDSGYANAAIAVKVRLHSFPIPHHFPRTAAVLGF